MGYGRLYLGDALATSGITQTYLDESSWTPFTGAGQSRSRSFTIADTSKRTVVVVAWTDQPATVNPNNTSMPTLVNDLDTEVVVNNSPCVYTGNIMSNELSTAECSAVAYDHWNNVEMIVIPPNSATSFTLYVHETTWGGGSTQSFATFAANAF